MWQYGRVHEGASSPLGSITFSRNPPPPPPVDAGSSRARRGQLQLSATPPPPPPAAPFLHFVDAIADGVTTASDAGNKGKQATKSSAGRFTNGVVGSSAERVVRILPEVDATFAVTSQRRPRGELDTTLAVTAVSVSWTSQVANLLARHLRLDERGRTPAAGGGDADGVADDALADEVGDWAAFAGHDVIMLSGYSMLNVVR